MKRLICLFISVFVLNTVIIPAKATTLPVLLYHNITKEAGEYDPDVHIDKELFKEHLDFLKENNYNTITLKDYYEYRVSKKELPENPIIITFDDGYYSNYEIAYPLLKEYGFKATIFMVTNPSYHPGTFSFPHFSYKEAREMDKSGVIDIESHSANHLVHYGLSASELLFEVRKSYIDLYFNLSKLPFAYAYPTGAFTSESKEAVKNAGYKMQLTVSGKLNNDETPLDEIKRMNIRGDCLVEDLKELILNSPF